MLRERIPGGLIKNDPNTATGLHLRRRSTLHRWESESPRQCNDVRTPAVNSIRTCFLRLVYYSFSFWRGAHQRWSLYQLITPTRSSRYRGEKSALWHDSSRKYCGSKISSRQIHAHGGRRINLQIDWRLLPDQWGFFFLSRRHSSGKINLLRTKKIRGHK